MPMAILAAASSIWTPGGAGALAGAGLICARKPVSPSGGLEVLLGHRRDGRFTLGVISPISQAFLRHLQPRVPCRWMACCIACLGQESVGIMPPAARRHQRRRLVQVLRQAIEPNRSGMFAAARRARWCIMAKTGG